MYEEERRLYCPSILKLKTLQNFFSSVQRRKWSPDRKWSPNWTANDPEPQMIPDVNRKWSRRKTTDGMDFEYLQPPQKHLKPPTNNRIPSQTSHKCLKQARSQYVTQMKFQK